jgi:hypothetical protein
MNDDITNKFSKEVKIKHYRDEIKRLALLQRKLEEELSELIGKDGEIGIREETMKMQKQKLSIWQRLGIIFMAILTACIGIGLVVGIFIFYITNINQDKKIELPEYIEENIEETEDVEEIENEKDIEDTEDVEEIENEKDIEDTKCLFNDKYYDKPENASCLINDTKNAWKCNDGFEEVGDECIEIEKLENQEESEDENIISEEIDLEDSEISSKEKCLFKNEYVEKPENASCIESSQYHAWKCNTGYVEFNDECILKEEISDADTTNKCLFLGRYYEKPENASCTSNDLKNAWKCNDGFEEIDGYKCVAE